MNKWFVIIAKRFLKMAVIGGSGSMAIAMASHPLTDLVEWKSWAAVLVQAFVVGVIAAAEKWTQGYQPQ